MAKYSKAAGKSVKTAMRKMKKGKLTSGTSDKKVTSKKQAVAIGLSEAREKGAKVPAKKQQLRKKRQVKKLHPLKKLLQKRWRLRKRLRKK
ncbi:DUF6496 domain-containing protein [Niabella ginsengisoli]|uniref:DUF6496 domain-containing protein n=1 Tax=Niabella ginsengisoli TaxID=522298 RepID=A0ABS9SEP3_9BACT|nr:DUF6496 domain-containing protein [Niabella ginsengisoli]MCH5596644.1 DUF6496 domain-containing protein [Niabella ginsengisoli]